MKFTVLFLLILVICTLPADAQLSTTPDIFETDKGELTVYAINHGSVAFTFDGKTILVDPYGGAELYSQFEAPDIIFITDNHGDHLNSETLEGLETDSTTFVVPQAVADELSERQDQLLIIGNNEAAEVMDIPFMAIPMYNFPGDETVRHIKGRGNGYIIDFGGKNLYLSGDTEDIPEMRALQGIDIAFVCMNLPYTMDIHQASSAVIEFQPVVVYPYHHRGQNIEEFKTIVDNSEGCVEVRLKNWYAN
ncbi:MAG: MBL fold metallo-hydrolase [Balneolales bacterium]